MNTESIFAEHYHFNGPTNPIEYNRGKGRVPPKEYSKMKSGVTSAIEAASELLHEALVTTYPDIQLHDNPLYFVEIERNVPSASTLVSRCVLNKLIAARSEHAAPNIRHLKLHRSADLLEDYAAVPVNSRGSFVFDSMQVPDTVINDTDLIAIDDVYVTGSATNMLHRTLSPYIPRSLLCMYVARLYVPEAYGDYPSEIYLNNSEISCLGDLQEFVEKQDFKPTRRYVKLLLGEQSDLVIAKHAEALEPSVREDVGEILYALQADNVRLQLRTRIPEVIRIMEHF